MFDNGEFQGTCVLLLILNGFNGVLSSRSPFYYWDDQKVRLLLYLMLKFNYNALMQAGNIVAKYSFKILLDLSNIQKVECGFSPE